ncbi:MAG: ParB/RepB/Spo0J family partition protein [Desulfovibrio sp.]|jgi:ParB family chromosome partitioning protein|nr:ParB/RepB/Spo0J family partition protein [Desulfovibrio sp.]
MAIQQTGLGKGLDGLIRNTQTQSDSSGPVVLPADDISPNPRQPRRRFTPESLEELAASIRSQGLLQPLLVRPLGAAKPGKYEIVAGERRWRACKAAGLTEIPAVIRSMTEQETLVAALIENLQREDLNPLEEALGLLALKDEFSLSQEEIALKLGKSRSAVANSLRLLTLPENMRSLLADGALSAGHARALLGIDDAGAREELKTLILDRHLSVRESEGLVGRWKESGRFALAGAHAAEAAGASPAAAGGETSPSTPGDAADKASVPVPGAKKRGAGAQSAVLMEIQTRIEALFSTPVKVVGKEEKGRISFVYNSKEELEALLLRLSGRTLNGRDDPALPGNAAPALPGRDNHALDGRTDPALSGAKAPALTGKDDPQLTGRDALGLNGRDNPALTGRDNHVLDGRAAPAPAGKDDPQLTGRDDLALDGRADPAPGGRADPVLEGRAAPAPAGRGVPALEGMKSAATAGSQVSAPDGGCNPAPAGDSAPPGKERQPPSQAGSEEAVQEAGAAPGGRQPPAAAFRPAWARPPRGPEGAGDDRA